MGLGKTYSADYLIDSNGNSGVSGQVLISTATGIDWSDGSSIIGGPFLPLAGGTMTGNTIHNDNVKSIYGTGSDLEIYHNGSHSFVTNNIGDLNFSAAAGKIYFSQNLDNGEIVFENDNGSGGVTTYLTIDGLSENTKFSKPAFFGDGVKALFGNSFDLSIYHDGDNSYIDDASGDGSLYINTNALRIVSANKGENMIRAFEDGGVVLSHNNVDKLQTTTDGITVGGKISLNGKITGLIAGTANTDAVNLQQLNDATTGALIFVGTWSAAPTTTSVLNGAVSSSATIVIAAANAGISTGATVTGTGISGTVTVSSVNADGITITISSTQTIADGATLTFTTVGGTPDLSQTSRKVTGHYYICETAGVATPNGASTTPNEWAVGDWVAFSDLTTDAWQKIDNSSVLSGAGTGGSLAAWSGSGTSVTLQDAPAIFSGSSTTFAGDVKLDNILLVPATLPAVNTPSINLRSTNNEVYFQAGSGNIFNFINAARATMLSLNGTTSATFTGDLMPSGENLYDIGSASVRWEDIYGDQVYGRDVYVDTKIIHNGDANTYIQFADTNDKIVLATNGSDALTINASQAATFTGEITVNDDINALTKIVVGESATPEVRLKKTPAGNAKLSFYNNNEGISAQQAYVALDADEDLVVYSATNNDNVFYAGGVLNSTQSSANTTFAGNVTADKATFTDGMNVNGNMSTFETTLTNNDDWQNSPISIGERGNVAGAQTADKYSPNLNFHWGGLVSKSLWMGANGHLNWGEYSAAGVPVNPADGRINANFFGGELLGTINTATTGVTQTAGNNSTKIATTAYADAAAASGGGNFLPLAGGTMSSGAAITFTVPSAGGSFINVNHSGNEAWTIAAQSGVGADDYLDIGISGGTRAMSWHETGNVGIGTTSPTVNLAVNKSVMVGAGSVGSSTTNSENMLIVKGKNNFSDGTTWYGDYGQILLSATTNSTGSARQYLITNALDGTKFAIVRSADTNTVPVVNSTFSGVNSGTADFVIDEAGRIGINTTSPNEKLQVGGNIHIYDEQGDSDASLFITKGSSNSTTVNIKSNGVSYFNGGNVGIGTTNPLIPLVAVGQSLNPSIPTAAASTAIVRVESGNGGVSLDIGSQGSSPYSMWMQVGNTSNNTGDVYPILLNPLGGNVGIGTEDPSTRLTLSGTQTLLQLTRGGGSDSKWFFSTDSSKLYIAEDTSATSNIKVTIVDSGKVGIGTTTPLQKLDVPNIIIGGEALSANFRANSLIIDNVSALARYYALGANSVSKGSHAFFTAPSNGFVATEVMRVTGTSLLIGKTADDVTTQGVNIQAGGSVSIVRTSGAPLTLRRDSSNVIQIFRRGSTLVGRIDVTTNSTSYGTSSDYRLKEDLQDFNGLDIVSKIKMYNFKWKNEDERSYGVVAHELQAEFPQAVAGNKDDVEMQGVDYSKLVPLLVKSVQELTEEIKLLKQQINK